MAVIKKIGVALQGALGLLSRNTLTSLPLEQQLCCKETWARMVVAQQGFTQTLPPRSW